ncbi:MAG: hypothetical protein KDD40_09645, partial [Bdellovibrionales bacterium]|nr:hypothetical protein [Bdellovibrionales bacterium]
NLQLAIKYGIIRGEQRIYFARSKEDAIANSQLKENAKKIKFYFIPIPNEDDTDSENQLQRLYVYENGTELADVSPVEMDELFKLKDLVFTKAERGLDYYSLDAWIRPVTHAIIKKKDSVQHGETSYGGIRKFQADAIRYGTIFYFNNRPEIVLSRFDKSNEQNVELVTIGKSLTEFTELQSLDNSLVYTVEVHKYSSDLSRKYGVGGIIAGVTGHRVGNVFIIDSIFYPNDEESKGLMYVLSALSLLIDRIFVKESGINFIEATKIKAIAQDKLRAIPVVHEQFMEMLNSLVQNPANVDLETSLPKDNDSAQQD